jgi:hypothetical protein
MKKIMNQIRSESDHDKMFIKKYYSIYGIFLETGPRSAEAVSSSLPYWEGISKNSFSYFATLHTGNPHPPCVAQSCKTETPSPPISAT